MSSLALLLALIPTTLGTIFFFLMALEGFKAYAEAKKP